MDNEPRKSVQCDRIRIDIDQPVLVQLWTRELGVTEQQLREAVQTVGARVEDVRLYLFEQ